MFFDSFGYLIFLGIVTAFYAVCRSPRVRQVGFLIAGVVFYGSFHVAYVLLMVFVVITSYLAALWFDRQRLGDRLKYQLAAGLVVVGLPLLVYKYFDFISRSFADLAALMASGYEPLLLKFLLPAGISFYTLQAIGYVVDVYVGRVPAERSLRRYALYVSFFPQLVAGPIERAAHLMPQLRLDKPLGHDDAVCGFRLVLLGLVLKVFGSDVISPLIDPIFVDVDAYGGRDHMLGLCLFSLQVYADFAGYSYVAIGTARIFGVHLADNFKQPFVSDSIPAFWRHWHMSLTTWLRDYVFNFMQFAYRDWGVLGTWFAIMVTFVLVGFWHGASWNFFMLGLIHGVLVIASNSTMPARNAFWKRIGIGAAAIFPVRMVITFLTVSVTLVFFRSHNLSDAGSILAKILAWEEGAKSLTFAPQAAGAVLLIALHDAFAKSRLEFSGLPVALRWSVYWLAGSAVFVALFLGIQQAKPFIYFQF